MTSLLLIPALVCSSLAHAGALPAPVAASSARTQASRLEILKSLTGPRWVHYVGADERLTPAGDALVDAELARRTKSLPNPLAAKDGAGRPVAAEDWARVQALLDKSFDGGVDRAAPDLGSEIAVDARVRNGTLDHLRLSSPQTGFSAEVGQLYIDQTNPQALASPYANLLYDSDSQPRSRWIDHSFHAQAGSIDLTSNFFGSQPGQPDQPDPAPAQLLQTLKNLGVPAGTLAPVAPYSTYSDPYVSHGIVFTSIMGQFGRAYQFGPVDAVWDVGALLKTAWVAANGATDETLGLRFKLDPKLYAGIFGGVQQNYSPIDDTPLQEGVALGTMKGGLYREDSPHASAAVWGDVPGLRGARFTVSDTERRNPQSSVNEGDASVMSTFLNHPISLIGSVSQENGTDIEYDRTKTRAEIDYQMTDRSKAYLAYQQDDIQYGNASLPSKMGMAGADYKFGGGSTLSIDQVFGGEYRGPLTPQPAAVPAILGRINQALASDASVAKLAANIQGLIAAGAAPAQLESGLNSLSLALSRLPAGEAAPLFAALSSEGISEAQKDYLIYLCLKTVSPGSPAGIELQKLLAQALGPGSSQDLFWLQSRVLGDVARALGGVSLTDAQSAQLKGYLQWASSYIQANPSLSPAVLTQLETQGLSVVESFSSDPLTPVQQSQIASALAQGSQQLSALLAQAGSMPPLNVQSVLNKIGDASSYFTAHKDDINELLGLLGSDQVWNSVLITAGRSALLAALPANDRVQIPNMGTLQLQLDAPAAIVTAGILADRAGGYGLDPVQPSDVEALTRRIGAQLLDLPPTATDQQISAGVFAAVDAQVKQQLAANVAPLLDDLNVQNSAQLTAKILASVPPAAAAVLQQNYGANLQGLIPPGATAAQLRSIILNQLPDKLMAQLQAQYGPQLAAGVEQALAFSGEVLSREMNMTLIQLMLSAEQLDRLSVDGGKKISSLDLNFALRSFDQLDKRSQNAASDRLQDAVAGLSRKKDRDEALILEQLTADGRANLEKVQRDPSWPKGLTVDVDDASLAPVLAYYGPGNFSALLARMKTRYAAKPRARTTVTIAFRRTSAFGGTSISRNVGSPDVQIVMTRPRDMYDAQARLKNLDAVVE